MRIVIGLMISATFLLAGCSSSQPSLVAIGDCEMVDEDDGFDLNGTFYDCENVEGAGVYAMQMACAYGYAGIERDAGNGTVEYTLTASNGTFYNASLGPEDRNEEDFASFDGNVTVSMRIETSEDFSGGLAFGMVCWDWEDW